MQILPPRYFDNLVTNCLCVKKMHLKKITRFGHIFPVNPWPNSTKSIFLIHISKACLIFLISIKPVCCFFLFFFFSELRQTSKLHAERGKNCSIHTSYEGMCLFGCNPIKSLMMNTLVLVNSVLRCICIKFLSSFFFQ